MSLSTPKQAALVKTHHAPRKKSFIKNGPSSEERPDTLAQFTAELIRYSDIHLSLVPEPKLLELVHYYKENGDRALIFTWFQLTVPILQEALDAEGIMNRQIQG
ncbi:hypothetical protein GE09DRAFT_1220406 [Coniochaeta sp. 2T2.1]|nr:hypothetical protein GE09DRAFT_1220406 [Coniochaeta sp. 2T2.1]